MPENEEAATAVYAKMVHKGVAYDVNRAISGQTLFKSFQTLVWVQGDDLASAYLSVFELWQVTTDDTVALGQRGFLVVRDLLVLFSDLRIPAKKFS